MPETDNQKIETEKQIIIDREQLKEDHDRSIRIDTSLATICKKIDRLQDKFDTHIVGQVENCKDCKAGLEDRARDKISWRHFTWIMAIVAVLLGSSLGWVHTSVLDNHVSIQKLEVTMEDHIDEADKFYEHAENEFERLNKHLNVGD